MLMEWLEPAIDNKILESISLCDVETKELDNNIMIMLTKIQSYLPESSKNSIFELESLINNKTLIVIRNSYKIGFKDGLLLGYNIKQDLEISE